MELAKTTVQQPKQNETMIPQSELTAKEIRETMQAVSQEHLSLEANGYVCTSEMLFDVLMKPLGVCQIVCVNGLTLELHRSPL